MPQPGCSGTPIIEARTALTPKPTWEFRVVGVLYARCTGLNSDPGKFVCAIPVLPNFKQLLSILHSKESSSRFSAMAASSAAIGDNQSYKDTQRFLYNSQLVKKAGEDLLLKFELGTTDLDIALPTELEHLWYQGVVKIDQSLLIITVRKKELSKQFFRYPKVPDVDLVDLMADYTKFIDEIRKLAPIKLQKTDGFLQSPSKYFRVDVDNGGEHNNYWMIDIQDNTGKFYSNKKSLSSVFAKILVPKTEASITGEILAELLEKSQTNLKPITHTVNHQNNNKSDKKHHKSKKKNGLKRLENILLIMTLKMWTHHSIHSINQLQKLQPNIPIA